MSLNQNIKKINSLCNKYFNNLVKFLILFFSLKKFLKNNKF